MSATDVFSRAELRRLDAARRAVRIRRATVAYCVYENPFARSGGIYAVARRYGAELSEHGRAVLLSPLHPRLDGAPAAGALRSVGACEVPFDGRRVPVELLEHVDGATRWVLMRARGRFGARGTDPYVTRRLLEDSLFAAAAVPHALAALGLRRDLVVHLQDWEFAAAALTVKEALLDGVLESAAVVLTSHNPYDQGLAARDLRRITARRPGRSRTVYRRMIPLVDAPVSTVSRTFAEELTSDPLQTGHFARHLQRVLAERGVVGIDNGLFGEPREPFAARAPDAVLEEKRALRRRMFDVLGAYDDPRAFGRLDRGEAPVFVMFGRLDPGQKGFDVLARAIERMPPGAARFIVTPIVGAAPRAWTRDLERLAERRAGDVVLYPFRMERGYLEAIAGADFAVMPSLYEPFGGATEPYLLGTPVLARATGGLVQQVDDGKTGLLVREARRGSGAQWRAIQLARTPRARTALPLYRAIVDAVAGGLERAIALRREDERAYARMLARLGAKAATFSWSRARREYAALYRSAVR